MSELRSQKRESAIEHFHNTKEDSPDFHMKTPAIHPRYRSAYGRIYPEDQPQQENTFFIRFIICVILFAGFLNLDQADLPAVFPDKTEIIQEVQAPFNIPLWKEFDLSHIL